MKEAAEAMVFHKSEHHFVEGTEIEKVIKFGVRDFEKKRLNYDTIIVARVQDGVWFLGHALLNSCDSYSRISGLALARERCAAKQIKYFRIPAKYRNPNSGMDLISPKGMRKSHFYRLSASYDVVRKQIHSYHGKGIYFSASVERNINTDGSCSFTRIIKKDNSTIER